MWFLRQGSVNSSKLGKAKQHKVIEHRRLGAIRPSFFMPFIAAKGGTAFEIAQQSVLNVSAVSVVYDRCSADRDSHDLAAAGNLSGGNEAHGADREGGGDSG